MPTGGALTMRTALRNIEAVSDCHGYVPPGHYAVLSVSDTGTGMSTELVEKIFDPFFTSTCR